MGAYMYQVINTFRIPYDDQTNVSLSERERERERERENSIWYTCLLAEHGYNTHMAHLSQTQTGTSTAQSIRVGLNIRCVVRSVQE